MKALAILLLILSSASRSDGKGLLGVVESDFKQIAMAGQSTVDGMDQGGDPHLRAGTDLVNCQFSGHNTYGDDGHGHSKLDLALEAGLHAVEVDETWGMVRERAVVTHSKDALGLTEPLLEDYLAPVWRAWSTAQDNDYLLTLDLKKDSAPLAQDIHHILEKHAAVLSHVDAQGVYHPGKITVMLTGSGTTERDYEDYARAHGGCLAFGHATSVPAAAPGFVRFLNLSLRQLLTAGKNDEIATDVVKSLVSRAHAAGYRVRVYLVNEERHWQTLIDAGVDWIATDAYQQAADYWRHHQAGH